MTLVGLLVLAMAADVVSEPGSLEDWGRRREGAHFALGGGADALAFAPYPSAGMGYLEPALNVGLAPAVDFRLTGSLGLGAGATRGGYGFVMFGLRSAFRFNPVPRYTLWLGFAGRLGVVWLPEESREPIAALPLYGPELSLASFRFGDRGQFEIDNDAGVFLPPIFGIRAGLAARYVFVD